MSAATAHAPVASPKEERFRYTNLGPVFFGLLVATAVGAAVCLVSFFVPNKVFVPYDIDAAGHPLHGPHAQFLFSWLFAFMFFFTISAGALFWTMLHYAVDAEWSVVVRRILETMANSFRWLWLAFVPIAVFAPTIYQWMLIPLVRIRRSTTKARCSTSTSGRFSRSSFSRSSFRRATFSAGFPPART